MILDILLLLAGLVLLVLAGNLFVKGAVGLSERLGVSPLVVGLTVVAFGTSAPELFVSVQAALSGSPGIAVGNVVGSNIANILLVVGLPALISPVIARETGVRRNLTAMLATTAVAAWMLHQGQVGRLDAAVLLAGMAAFIVWQLRAARAEPGPAHDPHEEIGETPRKPAAIATYLLGGLIGLPVAAQMTVGGASGIAQAFGISDAVIGLTIVAIGTSLPELATTFIAALRGSGAVAFGNVVGSNIFNIAGILGVTALVAPIDVDERIIALDMWVMAGSSLLLAGLGYARLPIGKALGTVMVTGFAAYIASFVI